MFQATNDKTAIEKLKKQNPSTVGDPAWITLKIHENDTSIQVCKFSLNLVLIYF